MHGAADSMQFSIVVPTYNRADELRETIRGIGNLSVSGDWELLVVDNKSTDHTRAVVEEASVSFPASLRYLFEPEQGRYAALNSIIRVAKGKITASNDYDASVDRHWLTRTLPGMEGP